MAEATLQIIGTSSKILLIEKLSWTIKLSIQKLDDARSPAHKKRLQEECKCLRTILLYYLCYPYIGISNLFYIQYGQYHTKTKHIDTET